MEFYEWLMIQRNGEVLHGVDSMPTEQNKMNCQTFILRLPGMYQCERVGVSPDTTYTVPDGFGLVFKMTVTGCIGLTDPSLTNPCESFEFIVGVTPLKQG